MEYQLPSEKLKNLTIVDTPGLGAGNPLHTKATEEFMNRADFAIWVFEYRNTGTNSERNILNQLKSSNITTFGVVNGIDRHDEEEGTIEEFIEEQLHRLHGLVNSLTPVSAKESLEGQLENNPMKFELSMWSGVEKIFTEIKDSPDEKANRIFGRLMITWNSSRNTWRMKKRKRLSFFIQHIIDRFLHTDFPQILNSYKEISRERQPKEKMLKDIERLFIEPVQVVDSTNNKVRVLSEIASNGYFDEGEWQAEWGLNCASPYHSLLASYQGYQTKITSHLTNRSMLTQEWATLKNKKYFKKKRLEKFSDSQYKFNDTNKSLQEDHQRLVENEPYVKSGFYDYHRKLRALARGIYNDLVQQVIKGELQWEEEWKAQQTELLKVSQDKLDMILELQSMIKEFADSLGLFFHQPFTMVESIYYYQKSRHLSGNIEGLIPNIPISDFNSQELIWNQLNHLVLLHSTISRAWNLIIVLFSKTR